MPWWHLGVYQEVLQHDDAYTNTYYRALYEISKKDECLYYGNNDIDSENDNDNNNDNKNSNNTAVIINMVVL